MWVNHALVVDFKVTLANMSFNAIREINTRQNSELTVVMSSWSLTQTDYSLRCPTEYTIWIYSYQ